MPRFRRHSEKQRAIVPAVPAMTRVEGKGVEFLAVAHLDRLSRMISRSRKRPNKPPATNRFQEERRSRTANIRTPVRLPASTALRAGRLHRGTAARKKLPATAEELRPYAHFIRVRRGMEWGMASDYFASLPQRASIRPEILREHAGAPFRRYRSWHQNLIGPGLPNIDPDTDPPFVEGRCNL